MYNHSNIDSLTIDIKTKAKTLGFMSCGISKAVFLEEEAPKLENWLNKNMNGEMSYMERNFDMRLDPTKIVEGAKSVISLTYNYYTEKTCKDSNFKISKYAYGNDYHFVIKNKLKAPIFTQQHLSSADSFIKNNHTASVPKEDDSKKRRHPSAHSITYH